jgi:hypothetical protein
VVQPQTTEHPLPDNLELGSGEQRTYKKRLHFLFSFSLFLFLFALLLRGSHLAFFICEELRVFMEKERQRNLIPAH